ncbi:MAG: hypothetical protein JWN04_5694 [Myxococcaceae bacterium]|nr:hypothetical protein [Myxococcaceae bacterium]
MHERLLQYRAPEEIADALGAKPLASNTAVPRRSVAPGSQILAVRSLGKTGERVLESLQWGLIARFFPFPEHGLKCSLARDDEVHAKAAFRSAFRMRRCIVPVDSFFASRSDNGMLSSYAFSSLDGGPLYVAGVWDSWTNPETGVRIRSCALVTIRAHKLVQQVQPRMLAILPSNLHAQWLGEAPSDARDLRSMLRPCGPEDMRMEPASPAIQLPPHPNSTSVRLSRRGLRRASLRATRSV